VPKIVDHDARRAELAEAVWRVIARDGVAEISIRAVAAEAGWSSGALRHYFSTRAELLAFACEQVIERVRSRIENMRHHGTLAQAVRDTLLETMPADPARTTEASIAFSFLALGLSDPRLAEVQRAHFGGMHTLCRRLIDVLGGEGLLAHPSPPAEVLASRLHALVDGLSVHVLAGHISARTMLDQLDAYLAGIIRAPDDSAAGHEPDGPRSHG
jgi:AcrR family transcriptional regulator